MRKIIVVLSVICAVLSRVCFAAGAVDISESEAVEFLRNASAVVFYSGPAYTLTELTRENLGGCTTFEEQKSKYPDARKYVESDGGAVGECTYLSPDDFYSILRYYFSKELADEYYERSMKSMARSKDGAPDLKLREIDGILYDFGNYGDPPSAYIIESDFKKADENNASLFLKYRPDSPPHLELEDTYEYEILEYEFELKKEDDGRFRLTRFTPIDDNAFKSVYPEYEYLYNPATSDAPVITDEEIEAAFSKAETMATWFTLFMPAKGADDALKLRSGGKEIYLKDGNITDSDDGGALPYMLIENYKNTDELERDLETVFSSDIAKRLLDTRYTVGETEYAHFIEYDGGLYYKAWAYASNYGTRPEIGFERVSEDGEKTVLRISYTDVNGTSSTYDYVYGMENGRRVFTAFELPQYLYYKDVISGEFASPMTSDAPIIAVCALALSAAAAVVLMRKKK